MLTVCVEQVGPRTNKDRERFPPNNIILMLAGAGLLWMGWSGFNGGDPYTVSTDASLAVLNTHVCTVTSLLTWLLLDILFFGKPSVIGATQGMITGLVCITPAAVPLRLSDEELQTGDDAIHGEEAYALWGEGEKYESWHNSIT
ncbi:hypothetical protein NC651_005190 [Populus alba x Populus x berolinensis]|nr:hypothetical protein NC651_005190 [Populus alba x Populus x berolinensis]